MLGEGEPFHHALGTTAPKWVAGFMLPPILSYHRGHTWVHWAEPDCAYVGLDDFARRLVGEGAKVSVAPVGSQVGEGFIRVKRDGHEVRLLAPVEGEIVSTNPRFKNDPDLVFGDNYGRGWICKIRSPHLFKEIPNLLNGTLAERWMEDTRDRFQHRLMLVTGNVIQDGGASIEDIASGLGSDEWQSLADEFLAQKPELKEEVG